MTSPLPPGPGSNPPAAHTLQLPGRGPGQTPSPSGSPPPDTTKLVIAGLIAALLSVVAVQAYIFQIKRGATEDEFTFFRMRVTREPGQTLTLDDVKLERVPDRLESSFPDVIRPNEAGEPLRLGDTFTRRAEQNVPLTARLFDDLEGDPARQLVKSGYRGVALPVVARSLPDPLKAEMRVDIMAPVRMSAATTLSASPNESGAVTGGQAYLPVMENVRVISVGSRSIIDEQNKRARGRDNYETLTIEVLPEDALLLGQITAHVKRLGVYSVLLRSPDDVRPAFIPDGGINPVLLKQLGISATP